FTSDDVTASTPVGCVERLLLMRESGVWTVGDPLPGQDLAAAREAPAGDPAAFISYGLQVRFDPGQPAGPADWAGEGRGPRVQLARRTPDGALAATRVFGYVGGRLMWLWERRGAPGEDGTDLVPSLSLELDRV